MPTINISCDTAASVTDHCNISNPDGTTIIGGANRRFQIGASTGSSGVGHSTAQAGTAALFLEASSPTVANDVGTVTFRERVGEYFEDIAFWYNRRGDSMCDLDVDAFVSGSWGSQFNLTGVDIANNATDVWRQQIPITLAGQPTQIRFRWTLPSTGTIWHADQAVDTIVANTDFFAQYIVSGVSRDYQGAVNPNCEMLLFNEKSGTMLEEARVTSDASGVWSFTVFDAEPRLVYARKNGLVFGCTDDAVIPSIV